MIIFVQKTKIVVVIPLNQKTKVIFISLIYLRLGSWVKLTIDILLFIFAVDYFFIVKQGIILAILVDYDRVEIIIVVVLFILVPSARNMNLPRITFVDIVKQNIYWIGCSFLCQFFENL